MDYTLPQVLWEYVNHGREERNLEFKETLDWNDRRHQAKLAKAVLGMSNIRNGGIVVIGVRKDATAVGLGRDDALGFTQDGVSAIVNEFAAPYAQVTVTPGCAPTDSSLWFVVVQVREFEEIPVLCRRDGHELRKGALYVRGQRIHETAEIRSEAEMREVLDMAVEKGIRAFYRRIEAAGLELTSPASHRRHFENQLEGL